MPRYTAERQCSVAIHLVIYGLSQLVYFSYDCPVVIVRDIFILQIRLGQTSRRDADVLLVSYKYL